MEQPRTLILCFDGTGNYFTGTAEDTNILKIYRMLDKNDASQIRYYQPGIGTYVTTSSLSDTSTITRIKAGIAKMKDAAIGTSLADHVMGGYKFLMQHFEKGAKIYFFGFSRGAYTARFLAQMVDEVGLLSTGNEEMCNFAWELFQQWERRTPEQKKDSHRTRRTMDAFRQTFGQDCHITFLGCFDTVFSVPKFENAWMKRSKFPYTAKSKAKVIRHAVAIDERRAKFRQHLLSEEKTTSHQTRGGFWDALKRDSVQPHITSPLQPKARESSREETCEDGVVDGDKGPAPGQASSPQRLRVAEPDSRSINSSAACSSIAHSCSGPKDSQDIVEIWFPGCHTDIGGGWGPADGEVTLLSHIPLVWMVHEAAKAGLRFNEDTVRELHCLAPGLVSEDEKVMSWGQAPQIHIRTSSPEDSDALDFGSSDHRLDGNKIDTDHSELCAADCAASIQTAAENGFIHDALQLRTPNGLATGKNNFSITQVLTWKMMEYFPFRRMDLRKDGSWKSRRFPLPMGEVRDIPHKALVHHSAIMRMRADQHYRPGNLIMGGGGRGRRRAFKDAGIGDWEVCREDGDVVGQCVNRVIPNWSGEGTRYKLRHQVTWDDKVWTCSRSHKSSDDHVPGDSPRRWRELISS